MAESVTDKLLDLKDKIDKAKEGKAKAEGKMEELMARLKKDFDITSLVGAKRKLEKLEKEAADIKKELDDGLADLEKEYDL